MASCTYVRVELFLEYIYTSFYLPCTVLSKTYRFWGRGWGREHCSPLKHITYRDWGQVHPVLVISGAPNELHTSIFYPLCTSCVLYAIGCFTFVLHGNCIHCIGECHNKDCPFLHGDQDARTRDCPWYDKGFCKHGECHNQHLPKLSG